MICLESRIPNPELTNPISAISEFVDRKKWDTFKLLNDIWTVISKII